MGLNDLKDLKGLLTVDSGDAAPPKVAPRSLKEIQSMETLRLWGVAGHHLVTDDWMKQVRAFKNLRNLVMDNAAITEKGLAELKGLTNLQSLYLNRATKITDAALKEIKQFKNLQDLNLGFTGWQQDTIGNAGTLRASGKNEWFGTETAAW